MSTYNKKCLELAVYAGEIMLKNGAETYRVEDIIVRICKAYNILSAEPFVTPTGIFVSINESDDNESVSIVRRIKNRTIDLNKISKVNDLSRKLSSESLSFEDGLSFLKKIDCIPKYNKVLKTFCAGIASAFFGILLGAMLRDVIVAFFISTIVYMTVSLVEGLHANQFIQNAFGGATASFLAILSMVLNLGTDTDKIIISSIMILLPGVAITNAVRDSISGDLISGLARATEAFIIAISIAVGVGMVMNIWVHLMGGVL